MNNPLLSATNYQTFLYSIPNRYLSVVSSSLVYIPLGTRVGRASGILFFAKKIVLCVQEFLNFELQVIEGYGYEVSRHQLSEDEIPSSDIYCRPAYPVKAKLYWYDSFPHPNDPTLARTHPHHKHVPPDIKHNRIPAPELTFTAPNLPFLIEEIETTLLAD